jgi:hypothetical protein
VEATEAALAGLAGLAGLAMIVGTKPFTDEPKESNDHST